MSTYPMAREIALDADPRARAARVGTWHRLRFAGSHYTLCGRHVIAPVECRRDDEGSYVWRAVDDVCRTCAIRAERAERRGA